MEEEEVLRDFDAQAQLIIQKEMLPKKSADRYTLVYKTYKNGRWNIKVLFQARKKVT